MLARVLLVLSLAFTVAHAADDELAAVSSLKVDLDKVVEYRTVSPVDGITVSGQPNEETLDIFAENGYAAVIDLRGRNEDRGFDEAQVVEELGMYYVELPIEGRDAVNFENAAKLQEILGQYDGPVLVHCGSGNRVGALLALGKVQEGVAKESAIEYGRSGGLTRLEGLVRERLEEDGAPETKE